MNAPRVPVICSCGYDGKLTSPLCPLHGERGLSAQVDRLRAVNAKLLEALREVTGELGSCLVRESDGHGDHGDLRVDDKALLQRARDAIEEARK